jgi:hypothetical protein
MMNARPDILPVEPSPETPVNVHARTLRIDSPQGQEWGGSEMTSNRVPGGVALNLDESTLIEDRFIFRAVARCDLGE